MSETIDPITWLRDSILSRKVIEFNDKTNELELENDTIKLPANAQTAWRRKDGKGYYTLGSLWMMMKMQHAKTVEYAKNANKLGFPLVDYRDKKDVTEYFTGQGTESVQIDTAMVAQTLIKKSDIRQGGAGVQRKRDIKAEEKLTEQQSKALKDKELSVTEYLALEEKPIHGRASVLQCRKKNFLKVLQLGYQLVQKTEDAEKIKERIEQRGAIAKDVNLDVQIFRPQQRLNLLETILNVKNKAVNEFNTQMPHPVIIVPGMLVPGNLSLANIKSFLEDGVYHEDPNDVGQPYSQMVKVTRRIGGKNVTFDVYDNVTSFTESRWTRVVAVFVNGQDYQFRDWKSGDSKRELFARVRGYYIHYANTQIPVTIKGWNIKRLELQRNKRHHDINIRNNFWSDLEDFLRREKFGGCDF